VQIVYLELAVMVGLYGLGGHGFVCVMLFYASVCIISQFVIPCTLFGRSLAFASL
jgi:hypothetical protein